MVFYISKIIIHNRAPFEHLELDFNDKTINVLSAINGGGKTTILSHITDAWFEITRLAYNQEFSEKEGKYYRVSSSLFSIDSNKESICYIRFSNGIDEIDYVDARGTIDKQIYDSVIKLNNKIDFSSLSNILDDQNCVKYVSQQDKKKLQSIFNNNIITSFPAYRYEEPGYLNDPFKVKLNYKLQLNFSGYLRNPVEVISGLPELANWLMDVLLDKAIYSTNDVFNDINKIFSKSLCSKNDKLSIGIGDRNQGYKRIQVGERDSLGNWIKTIYPSIFNMSSGENAMVCIFGEILRQYDNIKPNLSLRDASGVVLIDEVDKHLHIKLQKEILPKLFAMFPKVQFVISTHSPFVTMGLAEKQKERTKIIDLDHGGIDIFPEENDQYEEVYEMMISENERYLEINKKITEASKESSKPMLLVEDEYSQIYKIAYLKIKNIDFNVSNFNKKFNEIAKFKIIDGLGSGGVYGALNCKNPELFGGRKIVGLFDYDNEGVGKFGDKLKTWCIEGELNSGLYKKHRGCDMFALLLPIPKRLEKATNRNVWDSDASFSHNHIEVETLLSKEYLENNTKCKFDSITKVYKLKDNKKKSFWKDLVDADSDVFMDFAPLFDIVEQLLGAGGKDD